MASTTVDPNEQNYINPNLDVISSSNGNAADKPVLAQSASGNGVPRKPYYVTRTALNTTTGQTESDTALIS